MATHIFTSVISAKPQVAGGECLLVRMRHRVSIKSNLKEVYGYTQFLGEHGGTVSVDGRLSLGEEAILRYGKNEATVLVLAQVGVSSEGNSYAIQFTIPKNCFWGITFPEQSGISTSVKCEFCDASLDTVMTEIEDLALQVSREFFKTCRVCNKMSRMRAQTEAGRDPKLLSSQYQQLALISGKSRTINERKSARVSTKVMLACIRFQGAEDESVRVTNLSKGGFAFLSKKSFETGAWFEVAIPFTEGGINIFVPGRIARERMKSTDNFEYIHEYGVAFATFERNAK